MLTQQPDGEGGRVDVTLLDREHPEYTAHKESWDDISLLYASGSLLRDSAERFLKKRPKESASVFDARRSMFMYTNHMGTAVDWYMGELFEDTPEISASLPKGAALSENSSAFNSRFLDNCDRAGTNFVEKMRQAFKDVLLYRTAYILYDIPIGPSTEYQNLEHQIKDGLQEPYLCLYSPKQVINWQLDERGNLEWIVIKVVSPSTPGPFEKVTTTERWYVYDKTRFWIYERTRPAEESKKGSTPAFAELVTGPQPHLLSHVNRVPVQRITVPEGLWLANRAYLPSVAHLNMDNALNWSLFMGAMAIPVISSKADIDLNLSETTHIKLEPGDTYAWTEPEGKSWEHIARRLGELTENIFRAFYLIHQGRSGRATPTAQSGVSKQADMMPSKDILRMFGDLVRNYMKDLLEDVSLIRGERPKVSWSVRGFSFKPDTPLEPVQSLQAVMGMKIPSRVFSDRLQAKVVRMVLPDMEPAVYEEIESQIKEAKSPEERELEELTKKAVAIAKAAPAPQRPPTATPAQVKK
jgi:hypothetical protein